MFKAFFETAKEAVSIDLKIYKTLNFEVSQAEYLAMIYKKIVGKHLQSLLSSDADLRSFSTIHFIYQSLRELFQEHSLSESVDAMLE